MPDYKRGKIYRIVCNITGDTYYGSTAMQYLCNRKSDHNSGFKLFKQGLAGKCRSYDIIERGDWTMVLVENSPCNSKEELLMRERYYIENNECINKARPIISTEEHKALKRESYDRLRETNQLKEKERLANRTEEEIAKDKKYSHQKYLENKETRLAQCKARREGEQRDEILAKKREYHHNNKEKIAEKAKEYRESNKEKVAARKKLDYENNKEKRKETMKKYREDNREAKILHDKEYYAKNKDKVVTCECGLELKKWSLSRHKKTQKHINLLAQNCEE